MVVTVSKPITSMSRRDWWVFLTSTHGRVSRFDYNVKFLLPYFILSLVAALIDYSYLGKAITQPQAKTYAMWTLTVAFLWPTIAIAIKRLHDLNYSGWYLVTAYVLPLVIGSGLIGYFAAHQNIIATTSIAILLLCFVLTFMLILCCAKGTPGPNRFDAEPTDHNVVEGASL